MIEFYNTDNIDKIVWPESKEGRMAKDYLLPLMKHHPSTFIKNAETQLYVLKINEKIIPITQNEKEYENSYLLSTYFIISHLKEKSPRLFHPFVTLMGKMLKLMKINKVIIINNWLMSINPYPELSEKEMSAIIDFLTHRFPNHYFMFRSINTYESTYTFNLLKKQNFRLFFSRSYYLYNPNAPDKITHSMIRKQQKDFNKIARQNYTVEEAHSLSYSESQRVLDLYRQVYISKYTKYSPQYTPRYLEELLQKKIMNLKLLKKEGQIYGVAGFMQKENFLITNFFGYDTSIPQEEGLYRMLSGVIMEEIKKTKLLANQGSGAPDFKLWRGFTKEPEYVAIFDRHLPIYRRLFWSLAEICKPSKT